MAVERSSWGDALNRLREQMRGLQTTPELNSLAIGWQKGDWLLSHIGRQWLSDRVARVADSAEFRPNGPDVFIATTLYPIGGHTALMGDFARALAEITPEALSPHLIVTNSNREHIEAPPSETTARTGVDLDRIDILAGPELADRLEQLFERLCQLRPRRLFLFHHPDDPVACAVVQPEIAAQTFLVHHADRVPSFGLHLVGIQIIDVTPSAVALTRVQGLASALLLLTAPDPGARPIGFLQRENLVTATCGTHHKFMSDHRYGYAETVGVILRTTRGWHVHIGHLEDFQMSKIGDALRSQNVDMERFIHVPRTGSLATTLWEHGCDLYFASFPVDGARAKVEVLASATPYLGYSARPKEVFPRDELRPDGGFVWRSWEELEAVLKSASNDKILTERSKLMRVAYDNLHHSRLFAARLGNLLEGKNGFDDPHKIERERQAIHRVMGCGQAAGANLIPSPPEFSIAWLEEMIERATES
jgi:hypothetical protein